MKQTLKLFTLSILTVGTVLFLKAPTVQAASLTVNSTADTTVQDDGACTLREAINNINSSSDTTDGGGGGDCVAGDGNNDSISLPGGTPIVLTANLPQINQPVVIEGQGMGQTIIDGGGAYNIFSLASTSGSQDIRSLTITGINGAGVMAQGSAELNGVEITGENGSQNSSLLVGIMIANGNSSTTRTVNLTDVYVHDFIDAAPGFVGGILAGASRNSTLDLSINRSTFDTFSNSAGPALGFNLIVGLIDNLTPGTVNIDIRNTTISNIQSSAGAAAINTLVANNNGTALMDTNISNSTIYNTGVALGAYTAAMNSGATATSAMTATNLLLVDTDGCSTGEYPGLGTLSGTNVSTLTSHGGNLSDDPSCTSYFTHPTDQNNIGNLSSTLGTLSNNGGYVPTIPLLPGSPAIDAGVTVAGLTTDARLATRPQGTAFDSGAYESPYTKTSSAGSANNLAGTGINRNIVTLTAITLLLTSFAVVRLKKNLI